jgi:hypothetical protein
MSVLGIPATLLIHENLGVVMTFVYSRVALIEFRQKRFEGEWKYLEKAIFDLPEQRAIRSVLELGLLFRSIDDSYQMSSRPSFASFIFGELYDADGKNTRLRLRDVANKILHAEKLEWDFTEPDEPKLVCHAHVNQARFGWTRAVIKISNFAAICGGLMS